MGQVGSWIAQNWIWVLFILVVVSLSWSVWPRMQPNPRRILAGGFGLTYLTIVVARLVGGAGFPPEILIRAALMGLAGVLLLLSAYVMRLQGSFLELVGWSILGASALVAFFFRGSSLLVQAVSFLIAVAFGIALQVINESPVSEWENPNRDTWMR